MVTGLAIIPTIFASPYLSGLVDRLRSESIHTVLVDNDPSPDPEWRPRQVACVEPDEYVYQPAWRGVYKTWNYGMELGCQMKIPTLILNDDIILAPKAATRVCDELKHGRWAILGFDYNPSGQCGPVAVRGTFRHGGVGGFAFGVNPELCARVDERFLWWGGDDDLMFATAAKGRKVGIMRGATVEHPVASLSANARPDLLPEGWAKNDWDLLEEKWGAGW